ncbi:hypothetical protein AB0C13_38850 [Streptomyces sp. NPDC049099]|uniref:hypothetical protein n=1 Tax=Streptomyces sp. NPDC049099 TaxID=3155768 RepID=UPI00343A10C6
MIGGGASGIEAAAEVPEARPDLRVWIVGSSVADRCRTSPASRDAVVSRSVRKVVRSWTSACAVTDDERIFVVGDCAAVPGAPFACALAGPQAAHAVNTLAG